jgi:diacylglycerol kinase (ATP)
MNVDKYCMIIVGGGDGTVHEVVNGLIARADGKRIPICPVPNGSGDDFCASIGIKSVNDALD